MEIHAQMYTQGDVSETIFYGLKCIAAFIRDKFPKEVNRLWLVPHNPYGTESQVVVETTLVPGDMRYIILDGTISRLLDGSILYNIKTLEGETFGAEVVKEEIAKGNVLLVYQG